MAKRKKEPVEAIEPSLDGLETLVSSRPAPETLSSLEDLPEIRTDPEDMEELANPVLLIFGDNGDAQALADLGASCGFEVHAVLKGMNQEEPQWASRTYLLEDFENIEASCGIERNCFACILEEAPEECELLLSQCLATDASYIGIAGDAAKLAEVFSELRKDGVPDAELSAVAAPMGLNIGAKSSSERAVATVAEILAAREGKLKRLRQGHKKV